MGLGSGIGWVGIAADSFIHLEERVEEVSACSFTPSL